MGYLLKEALKTLCGVNQWSYAVFWKIGYQNPKLLIWEECYYESASCSRIPGTSGNENPEITFQDFNTSCVSTETCNIQSNNVQARDRLHLLVNKMTTDNHVLIVGEGLVGRVAFTGDHQWILSDNYYGEAHPPEVLKEVCQHFSAGMKTIAVIPVLPHGVVQFGSYLTIMENMGFVNDVISLVLQLGHVPGILLSDNYSSKELAPKIGVPVCLGSSAPGELFLESNMSSASSLIADGFNYVGSSVHTSLLDCQTSYSLATEVQNDLKPTVTAFEAQDSSLTYLKHHDYNQDAKIALTVKLGVSSPNQMIDGVVKAEVIPSNSEIWMKQHASLYIPRSTHDLPLSSSSSRNRGSIRCPEQKFLSGSGCKGPFSSPNVSSGILMSLRANSNLISSSNEAAPVTFPSVEVNELCEGAPQNMKTKTDINSFSDANRSVNESITSKHSDSSGLRNVNLSETEASFSDSFDNLTTNSLLGYNSGSQHYHLDKKFAQNEFFAFNEEIKCNIIQANNIPLSQQNEHLNMTGLIPSFVEGDREHKFEGQNHLVNNAKYNDPCIQPQSGDDLFDILGADFKNKLFSSCWNSCLSNESTLNMQNPDKNNFSSRKSLASLEMCNTRQGNSDGGIFSTGTDHLLDAVVSNVNPTVNQSLDDSVSCRTTLTNMSSSSARNDSLPYGRFSVSNQMKGELIGVPKYLAKAAAMSSCSLRTGSSKEDSGTYSQSSSIYESQISSWIETGHNAKRSNSLSTGCSKNPDEMCKTNRKRLKPGENPRPRPKDRQMIQDRVKELREIVPNGAKCSIDALLERTIKHMLFLQSVTKHADKLKQTGESKIINKDGSLLLKDNFEGGATWAYEVGSQSMVCPIIVEDLNQPRQMLVEMLCEERGLFLEIADIIRGLGLTILKGVMKTRNDKIWARFAVEANRDVTRMEIFISLVQLLEQSAKNDIPQSINISNDNPMVQQFHQATSLPVTGISHSLHRSNQ